MNATYFSKPIKTQNGWQVIFAAQVFHRSSEDWLKMRWGFNAAALLDEALDRQKLFIESQAVNEETFLAGAGARCALALRGVNLPEVGAQMALLGKANSPDPTQAQEEAQNYAREIFSIFPHDFLLRPAETQEEYERLSGASLLSKNFNAALIQRANAFIPAARGYMRLTSLWQTSARANEQIWRALSNTRQRTIFNVVMQPSVLYKREKEFLLELQKEENAAQKKSGADSPYIAWADTYVKRRLAAWENFFLLQVHVLAEGALDDDLLRAIGSALTRDTNDAPLPGFQIMRPDSDAQEKEWRERIYTLDFVPSALRTDDLADLDEAFSVFRFPYLPDSGLPGANFIVP